MFCKVLMFCLCSAKHRYYPTKAFERSLKLSMEFIERWWNHERAWPWRLVGKTLHNNALFPISRVMSCR